jgi:hypothetical protein
MLGRPRIILLLLLLLVSTSCAPDFSTPRYRSRSPFRKEWTHRRLPIWKSGTYRNPVVKPPTRREMLNTRVFNLDDW